MPLKASYRCLECGEIFENKIQAVIHSIETKHENYEMLGSGLIINIKS